MLDKVTTPPPLPELTEEMQKPANNFIAKAVPAPGGGFYAQWAAPGLIPDWVYEGDAPRLFKQEAAAEIAALRVLFDALNTRRRSRDKQEISRKMSGTEFAVALAEANIPPTLWAQMWGSNPDRIIDQIDGKQDVPFAARWILDLLKDPEALNKAIRITADNISYRQEFIDYLVKSGAATGATVEDLGRIPIEMTKKQDGS